MKVSIVTHQKTGHNRGNSMRSIVFRVLTTSGCIVVLYQVLKYTGEEIVVLSKCLFKREVHKLVHQSTSEWRTLCRVSHKRC